MQISTLQIQPDYPFDQNWSHAEDHDEMRYLAIYLRYGTAMNPATTGAAVSYGLLTRAYESEPFRNAMLRMANTPRGSTAFEKAMQQAQKAINALTQGAKSDALSE